MPTIYTEDPVGKAIEEHYYGSHGVLTGSVPNSIGYAEYQRRQSTSQPAVAGVGRPVHRGRSYQMLPLFQTLLDAIPRWAYVLLAVLGAVVGFATMSAQFGGGAGPYMAAGLGALAGWLILPVTIGLLDFAIQLTWLVIKLALVFGVVAGIGWVLIQAFG